MICWLRAQLERCLMDRAFRTLHEKIESQDQQIRNLLAARDKMASHAQYLDKLRANKVQEARQSSAKAMSTLQLELNKQIEIKRVIKIRHRIESNRQAAIIDQMRDFMDKPTFLKICEEVRKRPDSEFVGSRPKKAGEERDQP